MSNNLLNAWPFSLSNLSGKMWKTEKNFRNLEQMSLAESGKSEILGIVWLPINSQRDASLEVYLEMCVIQNGAFCTFWPWTRFPRLLITSVKSVRHSGIISVKILLKSVQYIWHFFLSFPGDSFPHWKFRLSYNSTPLTFIYSPRTAIRISELEFDT